MIGGERKCGNAKRVNISVDMRGMTWMWKDGRGDGYNGHEGCRHRGCMGSDGWYHQLMGQFVVRCMQGLMHACGKGWRESGMKCVVKKVVPLNNEMPLFIGFEPVTSASIGCFKTTAPFSTFSQPATASPTTLARFSWASSPLAATLDATSGDWVSGKEATWGEDPLNTSSTRD